MSKTLPGHNTLSVYFPCFFSLVSWLCWMLKCVPGVGRSWNPIYSKMVGFWGVPAGRPVWPGTCYTCLGGPPSRSHQRELSREGGSPLTGVGTPRLSSTPSKVGQVSGWCGYHSLFVMDFFWGLPDSDRGFSWPLKKLPPTNTEGRKEESSAMSFLEFCGNGPLSLPSVQVQGSGLSLRF